MLAKIEMWMSGKKTYMLSILGMLTVLVGWLSGEMSFMQFIQDDSFKELLAWAGLGSVRAALSKPPVA